MRFGRITKAIGMAVGLAALAACGNGGTTDSGREIIRHPEQEINGSIYYDRDRESIFDLFGGGDDADTTVAVNRYLWNASLDVLSFMPVEAADPFSGVIVFGYGTPPGGGTAYRATVYVRDPALDARSIVVALQSRGGPASVDATRAIEDAIMTRARQLRRADGQL